MKDGNSTPTVKLGSEVILARNFGLAQDVGEFLVDSPGSGTWTAEDESPLDQVNGSDLVVRNKVPIFSETDIVLTVTGTDQDDNPLTGEATIGAQTPEDQAYDIVPASAGKKFKTVTTITNTNGIAGDAFEICVLPDSADDVEMCYRQEIEDNPGTNIKQIRCGYEVKHTKKLPVEKSLSITMWYTNNLEGMDRVRDREVMLVAKQNDDGRGNITEYYFWDGARLSVTKSIPADGEGEQSVRAEGFYKRRFIFS